MSEINHSFQGYDLRAIVNVNVLYGAWELYILRADGPYAKKYPMNVAVGVSKVEVIADMEHIVLHLIACGILA